VGPVASTSRLVQLRQEEAEIRRRLTPLLTERGLLVEHWRIIAVVDDHPGIPMSTVAASAVVPGATLTRHVDKLVELGIIVRHVDPDDRRRVVVALSPHGRQYADRLRAAEAGSPSEATQVPSGSAR
jgi:DNA-binding MarR family transcriptional regulator